MQEQLSEAQENQRVEAASAAAALTSSKCIQSELQAARDRIKYLENAISGHVTRLQAQDTELSGANDHLLFFDVACHYPDVYFYFMTQLVMDVSAS